MENENTEETNKKTPLSDLLIRKRSQKNLSIDQVWKSTRISQRIILDLEEGRFENLPSKVYLKGFLRSLAKFYEEDEKVFLSALNEIFPEKSQTEEVTKKASMNTAREQIEFKAPNNIFAKNSFSPKLILGAVFLTSLTLLLYSYFIKNADKKPIVATEKKVKPEEIINIKPIVKKANYPTLSSPNEKTVTVQKEIKSTEVSQTSIDPSLLFELFRVPSNDKYKTKYPSALRSTDGHGIFLISRRWKSSVIYVEDDDEVKEQKIPKGTGYFFKGQTRLLLKLSSTNHFEIFYNGQILKLTEYNPNAYIIFDEFGGNYRHPLFKEDMSINKY